MRTSCGGRHIAGGTSPAMVAEVAKTVTDAQLVVFVPAMTGPDAEAKLLADMEKYKAGWPGLWGSPAEIAAGVAEFAAAGASKVILQTVAGEDPVAYVRWVAEQVKPLVD